MFSVSCSVFRVGNRIRSPNKDVITLGDIQSFRDIEAWQVARELTRQIYELTSRGKLEKDYGLKGQIQRSSISIMSNIAEGFERDGNKEFIQFLSHAKGSNGEVLSQLIVANDIGYISDDQFNQLEDLTKEIANKLGGFIRYLKQSDFEGSKFKSMS